MVPFADAFCFGAAQHFDHVLDADAKTAFFPNAIDARKKLLRGDGAVPGFARGEAVVARAAIAGMFVAKVIQQESAPAGRRLGVMDNLLQLSAGDVALLWIGHLDNETAVFDTITRAEEKQA